MSQEKCEICGRFWYNHPLTKCKPKQPSELPSSTGSGAMVRALENARDYLIGCSTLLDGPDSWNDPQSGVGSIIAEINAALPPNCDSATET